MPSINDKSPTETAREARFNWYVRRGARHSSTVGINGKNEQRRSGRLAHPDPRAHRQRLAEQRNRRTHAVKLRRLNGLNLSLTVNADFAKPVQVENQRCSMPGLTATEVFPDKPGPVIRNNVDGGRELVNLTWGMPSPSRKANRITGS